MDLADKLTEEGRGKLRALLEAAKTATQDGEDYPAEAFAYVPDPEKPSTWKLRLWESPSLKVTVAQLGRAAAAFSAGGFRGNKVELTDAEAKAAKAKIRAAYKKFGTKTEDIPESVKEQLLAAGVLVEYTDGEATLTLAEDVDPAVLEVWAELPGSLEDRIASIRQAVQSAKTAFGATVTDEDWCVNVEATFSDHVLVGGPDDQKFTADWAMDEAGEVTLSNIRPVTLTVQVNSGAETAATTTPELLESFRSPVRVLAEADRKAGKDGPTDHLMTVECVLGCAETPTKNGRVYTRGLFEKLVTECAAGTDRSRRWLGESDHPSDGHARLSSTVSKPWRNLRLESDGRLLAETDVIDTSLGADLQKLIRNEVPVQVSSRTFASTTQEVRSGQTVQVVNEQEALEHWGGWDFVLGAAASGAGVQSYTEVATPAAGPPEHGDPGDVDEVLATMDPKELAEAMVQGNAPLVEKLTALMERTEPKPAAVEPVVEAAKKDEPVPVVETVDPLKSLKEAIVGTDEVKAWSPAAQAYLATHIAPVTEMAKLKPALEEAKTALQELGLVLVDVRKGAGITAAHVASSKEAQHADRAGMFQKGHLPKELKPDTVQEMVSLLSEGIEDNGLRSSGDPDDPIRKELADNLPFQGYHPGNPKHQFEALVYNMVEWENRKFVKPWLKPYQEWTAVADIAQSVPFVLPMIRQMWPRLIAKELCSVQPMNKSTGLVHYLDIVADPSNADFSIPGHWNSEYAQHISEQTAVREMGLTVTSAAITMDTKKLSAEWSTEVRQNLQYDHGIGIAETMMTAMVDEIAREVNALLLNDMRLTADPLGNITAGNVNYGTQLPAAGYTNLSDWRREIYTAVLQADALVRAQRRARTNWIVAGPSALIRLMALEQWTASANDASGYDWNVGINRVGTISGNPTYNVYGVDADIFPTAVMLLGRRGPEWPDAGEVYCPWIPLYTTPVITAAATFCERESAMSRFGYRKVVGNAYATVTCLAQPGVPY